MNAVWKSDLPSTRKFVALSLADQANDMGECYPSIPMIAQRCSLSDRAVRGAIRELEQANVIRSDMRTGRSTVYVFTDPGTWCRGDEGGPRNVVPPGTSFPRQDVPPSPAGDSAPPRNVVPPTPERGSAITTTEPPIEPPSNQKLSAPSDRFDEFWSAYPKREAKPDARKAWAKVRPSEVDAILADLAARAAHPAVWNEIKFVPLPATYIRGRRWEDEWTTAANQRAGPSAKPSAADNFTGKTYTGTPIDDLPPEIRDAVRAELAAAGHD